MWKYSFTAGKGHKRHLVQPLIWYLKLSLPNRIQSLLQPFLSSGISYFLRQRNLLQIPLNVRVLHIILLYSALRGPDRASLIFLSHWPLYKYEDKSLTPESSFSNLNIFSSNFPADIFKKNFHLLVDSLYSRFFNKRLKCIRLPDKYRREN